MLFLQLMLLCKPIRAAYTSSCYFELNKLVQSKARASIHEYVAFCEWSVTRNFPAILHLHCRFAGHVSTYIMISSDTARFN